MENILYTHMDEGTRDMIKYWNNRIKTSSDIFQ